VSGPSRVYAGGGGTADAECTVRGDDLHSNSTTDAGFSTYTDARSTYAMWPLGHSAMGTGAQQ